MISITAFSYASKTTPIGYTCEKCDATGVRLYREYQTTLDHLHLYCRACACKIRPAYLADYPIDPPEHNIGSLVAAVPTEEGDTFWGFTSVPERGVEWWDQLPKSAMK